MSRLECGNTNNSSMRVSVRNGHSNSDTPVPVQFCIPGRLHSSCSLGRSEILLPPLQSDGNSGLYCCHSAGAGGGIAGFCPLFRGEIDSLISQIPERYLWLSFVQQRLPGVTRV